MSSNYSKTKQSFVLAVGKISAQLLTFCMPLFLSRFLSKHDYGIYAQFNVATSFVLALASFGFPASLYYFFANVKEHQYRSVIYNTILALMIGAGCSCVLLAIPGIKTAVLGSEILAYFPLLLLAILLFISTEILEPFYIIQKDQKMALLYPPLVLIFKVLSVVFFALLIDGIIGVFVGIVITDVLIFLFTHFYCWQKSRYFAKGPLFDLSLLKRQFQYVVPYGSAVVLNTFTRQLDKIICISYLTVEAYASYSLAFFGIPGIYQIYASISNVYLVNMSNAFAEKNYVSVKNLFHEMTAKVLSFTVPVILIVCLYSRTIICFLFTSKYEDAAAFFQVYIFTLIVTQLGTGLIIRASGQTKYSFLAYLYSGFITVPGTFLAIRYWGAWGGITATIAAQLFPKMLQGWYEMKILSISFGEYLPWKKAGKILFVSFLFLIPFLLLQLFYAQPIYICILTGGIYMLIVQGIFLRKDMAFFEKGVAISLLNRFHLNFLSNLLS